MLTALRFKNRFNVYFDEFRLTPIGRLFPIYITIIPEEPATPKLSIQGLRFIEIHFCRRRLVNGTIFQSVSGEIHQNTH
jgi:hypothetical protein